MVSSSTMFSFLSCLLESVTLLSLWNIFCRSWIPFKKQMLVGTFHTLALFCRSLLIELMVASGSVTSSFLSKGLSALSNEIFRVFSVVVFSPFPTLLFLLIAFVGFREISAANRLWTALYAYTTKELLRLLLGLILPWGAATSTVVYIPFAAVALLLAMIARRFRFPHWVERQALTLRILCGAVLFPFILWWLFVLAAAPFEAVGAGSEVLLLLLPYIVVLLGVAVIGVVIWVIRQDKQRDKLRNTADRMVDHNRFIDEIRAHSHDFNKHIRYLRNAVNVYSEQQDFDGLTKDVNAYCEELLEHSEKDEILLHLNDPTLRALLYGRHSQARTADIDFILDASPELPHFPVKNYQLVEIVDNLMDNAFECVCELPEHRWIRTVLQCESMPNGKSRHSLCIQNPCKDVDLGAIVSGTHYTTKGDGHRGIGLQRVSSLVSDTGGKLIFSEEHDVFSVNIVYED